MRDLSKIDQRGTWILLLQLMEGGKALISELIETSPLGQTAVYNRVKDLNTLGLIIETREPYYNRRWIELTPKGQYVAEKLNEILRYLDQK